MVGVACVCVWCRLLLWIAYVSTYMRLCRLGARVLCEELGSLLLGQRARVLFSILGGHITHQVRLVLVLVVLGIKFG